MARRPVNAVAVILAAGVAGAMIIFAGASLYAAATGTPVRPGDNATEIVHVFFAGAFAVLGAYASGARRDRTDRGGERRCPHRCDGGDYPRSHITIVPDDTGAEHE